MNEQHKVEIMVETALVELDQMERDCNFTEDEKVKFKLKLIARLTEFTSHHLFNDNSHF